MEYVAFLSTMQPINITKLDVLFVFAHDGPDDADYYVSQAVADGYTHLVAVAPEGGFSPGETERDVQRGSTGGLWLIFTKPRAQQP